MKKMSDKLISSLEKFKVEVSNSKEELIKLNSELQKKEFYNKKLSSVWNANDKNTKLINNFNKEIKQEKDKIRTYQDLVKYSNNKIFIEANFGEIRRFMKSYNPMKDLVRAFEIEFDKRSGKKNAINSSIAKYFKRVDKALEKILDNICDEKNINNDKKIEKINLYIRKVKSDLNIEKEYVNEVLNKHKIPYVKRFFNKIANKINNFVSNVAMPIKHISRSAKKINFQETFKNKFEKSKNELFALKKEVSKHRYNIKSL